MAGEHDLGKEVEHKLEEVHYKLELALEDEIDHVHDLDYKDKVMHDLKEYHKNKVNLE